MTPEDMFQLIEAAIAKRPEEDRVMWLRYSAGAAVFTSASSPSHPHVRWFDGNTNLIVIGMLGGTRWYFSCKYRTNTSDSIDICAREMLRALRKYWLPRVQGSRP